MKSDINRSPSTGAEAIYVLKNVLTSSGWTVYSSSNGTTELEGDSWGEIASASNNYSWAQLRSPDNTRWITFQRGTSNPYWRIKYLSGSYNNDGTSTTTPTPVSGEGYNPEAVLCGGGTDASPSFTQFFDTDGSYKSHVVADEAAPYGWWFGTFYNSSADPRTMLVIDPLSGSLPGDPDPVVLFQNTSWTLGYPWNAGDYSGITYNSHAGLTMYSTGSSWVRINAMFIRSPTSTPMNNAGPNALTGKLDTFPVFYWRTASEGSPTGYKGVSSLFKWVHNSTALPRGDILNIESTGSHVVLSTTGQYCFALPWVSGSEFIY